MDQLLTDRDVKVFNSSPTRLLIPFSNSLPLLAALSVRLYPAYSCSRSVVYIACSILVAYILHLAPPARTFRLLPHPRQPLILYLYPSEPLVRILLGSRHLRLHPRPQASDRLLFSSAIIAHPYNLDHPPAETPSFPPPSPNEVLPVDHERAFNRRILRAKYAIPVHVLSGPIGRIDPRDASSVLSHTLAPLHPPIQVH